MTELIHTSDVSHLDEEWRYAKALTVQPERGGASSLLPKAYQNNPSNVLIAIGLGRAIGITPAQALYEIYVVNNRPSPSANLMAALVRRAGHKIRIKGDATTCTATLIRSDDPDEPFTATWTLDQAKAAGLTGKDTWKAYPAAMLRARAISEVVRMGASECVLGMDYSAEELRDVEAAAAKPKLTAAAFTEAAEPAPTQTDDDDYLRLVGLEKGVPAIAADEWPNDLTESTRKRMFAVFNKHGITDRDEQIKGIVGVIGRTIESRAELTEDEARAVILAVETHFAAQGVEGA